METVAAETAHLEREGYQVGELQWLAPEVFRATSKALRFHAEEVSAGFLIAASRALTTADDLLHLLDHHVWPGRASRTAKRGLYRDVAARSRSHRVRAWLAAKEDPRRDPVVRAILMRSHSVGVLVELLRDPRGVPAQAFPALLDRLARRSPEDALEVIEARLTAWTERSRVARSRSSGRAHRPPALEVGAGTATRLLRSESAATREAMLALLPQLEVSR